MSEPFSVNRAAVRRFLLERQGLFSEGQPTDVMERLRRLECIQIDPIAVVERNQHLVLSARLPGYPPEELDRLLDQGQVFEYIAQATCVIPMADYPQFAPVRQ